MISTQKRPDLLMLVAIWAFFCAFLSIIGIILISLFILPEALGIDFAAGNPNPASMIAFIIGLLFLLCFGTLSLAGGIGILKAKNWGRMLCIISAAFCLVWFPIGTVVGVLVLVYLTKTDVREYFEST